jgi:hypothetical protein
MRKAELPSKMEGSHYGRPLASEHYTKEIVMNRTSIALFSFLLVSSAVGCGTESTSGDESVTEGIVTVAPDGTQVVRYVQVPMATYNLSVQVKTLLSQGKLAPSDEEAFLRAAGNKSTVDSVCNASSFWLHEQTNQGGPIMCLARTNTAGFTSIGTFTYSDGVNVLNSNSYWAGATAGMFHNFGGGGGPTFSAFQRVDMVNFAFGNFPFLDQ